MHHEDAYSRHIELLTDSLSSLKEQCDKAIWEGDQDHAAYLAYMAQQCEHELFRTIQQRNMSVNRDLSAMESGYLTGMKSPILDNYNYAKINVKSDGETWEEVPHEDLAPDTAIELQDIMI